MEPWFNLEDVHRAKQLRSSFSGYRERVERTMPMHVRHLRPRAPTFAGGRPKKICVVDKTGLHKLVGELVEDVEFTPMVIPMRFTDAARSCMVGADTFTTFGLEESPQKMDRAQFMAFLADREELAEKYLEPDFENL